MNKRFMSALSIMMVVFAVSASMAAETVNQVVNLKCIGEHNSKLFEGFFFLKSYDSGTAFRGTEVYSSSSLPYELRTIFNERYALGTKKTGQDMTAALNKYNGLPCEKKTLRLSFGTTEKILVCGPGSEISFSPDIRGLISGKITIEKSKYFANQFNIELSSNASKITDIRPGHYSACDEFAAPTK